MVVYWLLGAYLIDWGFTFSKPVTEFIGFQVPLCG